MGYTLAEGTRKMPRIKKIIVFPSNKISSKIEDWHEAYSIKLNDKQIIQIKEGILLTSDGPFF